MPDPTQCPPPLPRPWPPAPLVVYSLPGPQVEPSASYWTDAPNCPVPCVVTIADLEASGFGLPNYPTNAAILADELAELRELASLRDDPEALVSNTPGRRRRPLSAFLQLRPQPLGAVFNRDRVHELGWQAFPAGSFLQTGPHMAVGAVLQQEQMHSSYWNGARVPADADDVPVIKTGRELARYFENETPGLAHQLALNYLLPDTMWSPPRQALVWMALNVAIYSALAAAWYFKWRGAAGVSRRPRPIEADHRVSVLYNRAVDIDADADGARRLFPEPSPGTPRHPAYPSGHSTYSAAASEILSYFFPDYAAEFDNLANNIGTARLWAGIHWRSDHVRGAQLGRQVAQILIRRLQAGCVTAPPNPCDPMEPCAEPPSKGFLDECAKNCCESAKDAEAAAGAEADHEEHAGGERPRTPSRARQEM
jgi:hypothetical protein